MKAPEDRTTDVLVKVPVETGTVIHGEGDVTAARARLLQLLVEPAQLRATVESLAPVFKGGRRARNLDAAACASWLAKQAETDERVRQAVDRLLGKRDDDSRKLWAGLFDESADVRAKAVDLLERVIETHYRTNARPTLARRHRDRLERRGIVRLAEREGGTK